MFKYVFIFVSLFSFSALAAKGKSIDPNNIPQVNQCQTKFSDRIDYSRCLDSVLAKYERNMTTWQQDIDFKLKAAAEGTGRNDAEVIFNASTKSFFNYRDKHCQWQYLAMLPDVSSAVIIAKECKIQMTVERINNLMEISAFEF